MAKVKELSPAKRPAGLALVTDLPLEPPITIPTGNGDAEILTWCESMRDEYEKNEKKLLTVKGLLHMATVAGLDETETKQVRLTIKRLYAAELGGKPTKPETKPAKKTDKKVVAEKPPKNGNGKHTKAEKPVKDKPAKPTKPKKTQVESELIYDKKVRGIDVTIYKTEKGLFRVAFDGVPMRGVMRYLGARTWKTDEVESVVCKLLAGTGNMLLITVGEKKVKGYETYVHQIIGGGHVGAGFKAGLPKPGKKGKESCFGKTPILSADLYKRLDAIR